MPMRVRTFIGKSSIEGLQQLDSQINQFFDRKQSVVPKHITQVCGNERHHGQNPEPCVVVSIWYEDTEDEF